MTDDDDVTSNRVVREMEARIRELERQQVVRLIREDILNGNLVPGQRLVKNALCEVES